jgi:hypothetical protein
MGLRISHHELPKLQRRDLIRLNNFDSRNSARAEPSTIPAITRFFGGWSSVLPQVEMYKIAWDFPGDCKDSDLALDTTGIQVI